MKKNDASSFKTIERQVFSNMTETYDCKGLKKTIKTILVAKILRQADEATLRGRPTSSCVLLSAEMMMKDDSHLTNEDLRRTCWSDDIPVYINKIHILQTKIYRRISSIE